MRYLVCPTDTLSNHHSQLGTQRTNLQRHTIRLAHCRRFLLFERLYWPRDLDRSSIRFRKRY